MITQESINQVKVSDRKVYLNPDDVRFEINIWLQELQEAEYSTETDLPALQRFLEHITAVMEDRP
jgi:hypothetical protein